MSQLAENYFQEVYDALYKSLMQSIDQRHLKTGEDRHMLCVQVGKALVLLGSSFAGNGLMIDDPDLCLQPAMELLEKLRHTAERIHKR